MTGSERRALQPPDEPVDLLALDPFAAVEAQGISDDDPLDAVASDQIGDRPEIRLAVLSGDGRDPLGRHPELVAEGDPDSPAAVIQPQYPHPLPLSKKLYL